VAGNGRDAAGEHGVAACICGGHEASRAATAARTSEARIAAAEWMNMTRKMTKGDLYAAIAIGSGCTTKQAAGLAGALIEIIKSTLADGEDLLISGFGKFCIREKMARVGRNPSTGERIILEARRVVVFRPSGKLRERINKG
jgi:integration host factor subunit alpha